MNEQIIVRRAVAEDADAIVAGINQICSEGGAFYVTSFALVPPWDVVLFQPELARDHLVLVAERSKAFAGAIRLFPGAANTAYHHVAELGVFVLLPHRRLGIGRQLLQSAIDWAPKAGVEKIVLRAHEGNLAAISLYQSMGFFEEGRRLRQLKLNNQYHDEILAARFV